MRGEDVAEFEWWDLCVEEEEEEEPPPVDDVVLEEEDEGFLGFWSSHGVHLMLSQRSEMRYCMKTVSFMTSVTSREALANMSFLRGLSGDS